MPPTSLTSSTSPTFLTSLILLILLLVPLLPARGQTTTLLLVQNSTPETNPELAEAQKLNQQAIELYQQGKYAEAIPLLQQALEIRKKVLGLEHPHTATSLNNLAFLYQAQGNYSAAEPLYLQALEIRKKVLGLEHPHTATSLNNLAVSYWSQNDIPRTLTYLQQGLDTEETILTRNLATGSEQQKQLYFNTFGFTTNAPISLHLQNAPENQEAANLALTTILRRKGRILDTLSNSYQTLRQNLKPEDRELFTELNQTRSQLASLVYQGIGNKTVEAYQKEVAELESKADKLEATLSSRSAEFKVENQKVTIEAIQKLIPQDKALVEYISYQTYDPKAKENKYGKSHYAVYILFPNGTSKWIDLGAAETIETNITALKNSLDNPDSTIPEVQQAARRLDTQIMQPVRKLLGNTRNLLISPDSQLNLIPFAALVDENNKYLVENYSISYLTSGRDLLKYQLNPQAKDNAVLVANPNYQTKINNNATIASNNTGNNASRTTENRSVDLTRLDWCCDPLAGTEAEAKAISPLLANPKLFTGNEATESNIESFQAPLILHIASHGFFLEDQPDSTPTDTGITEINDPNNPNLPKTENPLLRSGIALTGFNPAQNQYDGALTALEVSGLNLYGTKLVVLSACQTGLGDVKDGEGVYGLRRALVLSGAESQLISLWNVADEATKDLMVDYYQKLLEKTGRSEALRQVQLQFLKNPESAHPFFWAAFIPSGNWTAMELN
jgi:CHAT domain-containing protein